MIDHIGFGVSDYERSKAFYSQALAPLGIELYGSYIFDPDVNNIEAVCHRPV